MVGWGCGRGLSGCVSLIAVQQVCCDGIVIGRELSVSSGWDMEVSCEILEWTLAGQRGKIFV